MSTAGREEVWAGTRTLVTGATGFIGFHLMRQLASLGAEIHAVSRRPPERAEFGEIWHRADLRSADATLEIFGVARPDVVFHLASEVNGARDPRVVLPTLEHNLISTVNVLGAAIARPDVRLLLCGSSEEPRLANGHSPPPSPYAMAKWAATGYAQLFQRLWNVPITILRPTMVYGPGQQDTTKLVPYVTLALLRGEEPRLTSGAKLVDWVYVDDVVDAFVTAARSDGAVGQIFDIGTGTRVSVRETVELLFHLAGRTRAPEFGAVPDRPHDIAQTADLEPVAKALGGWRPAVGLEEGLKRTFSWYAREADGKR
ncbi:NAD-dependent epimerase/dehydratase family protein [Sphaerimonospora thailandensis]|uniref:NAD-dependent dehydratase n=1 Tax=Sphaerimonospora thailandensis TaxID=795644 RepID=A0A8J3R760_9ACTN|nr:NAD-dependent epimerase/dehydratase family protein [Sphaerimonospora thailandensis]GIH69051.1 NAD-dependent dehydratase [Sphaerimonospora thailandensis]